MIKVKENQLSLNDVLYDTGDLYSSHHEVKKVVIWSLISGDSRIEINNNYYLYKMSNNSVGDYYYNNTLFFSEKKATNVVNDYIRQQNKRKEKYEKEKEREEKYKQQIIDEKLEEKYVGKLIMLNRGEDGWVKTRCKEVCAWETGIYLIPNFNGHICKLSREGKTWKMWSELEELEEEKKKLEERINALKGENNVNITN